MLTVTTFYKELSSLSVVLERKAVVRSSRTLVVTGATWQMLDTRAAEWRPDTVWQILIKLAGQGPGNASVGPCG